MERTPRFKYLKHTSRRREGRQKAEGDDSSQGEEERERVREKEKKKKGNRTRREYLIGGAVTVHLAVTSGIPLPVCGEVPRGSFTFLHRFSKMAHLVLGRRARGRARALPRELSIFGRAQGHTWPPPADVEFDDLRRRSEDLHRSEGDEGSIAPATGCPPRAGKSPLRAEECGALRGTVVSRVPRRVRTLSASAHVNSGSVRCRSINGWTGASGRVKTPRKLEAIAVYLAATRLHSLLLHS